MNPILVLLGLLVLSYIGGFLVGGRAIRGFGLPSGSEYVALGFLVGPQALGLVDRSVLGAFEPIAQVAIGWLALVIGLDYGFRRRRRVPARRIVGSIAGAVVTGSGVGLAVFFASDSLLGPSDRLVAAIGVGAACAETTRHAVRWVVERHRAKGPLSDLVHDLSGGDDIVPIAATGVAFALHTDAHLRVAVPAWGWVALTIGVGVVLGLVAAVLLGKEFRLAESWGVLLGTSVFAIGTAARMELSTLLAAFALGATLSAASRHRAEIRAMVRPTERPVLLPALLLAGASIDVGALPKGAARLVAAAIVARLVCKIAIGLSARATSRAARGTVPLVGLGLFSAGGLAMSVGLAFALRFPGPIGELILTTAALATVLGELVGPGSLRRALERAGELDAGPTPPPPEAVTPSSPELGGSRP